MYCPQVEDFGTKHPGRNKIQAFVKPPLTDHLVKQTGYAFTYLMYNNL